MNDTLQLLSDRSLSLCLITFWSPKMLYYIYCRNCFIMVDTFTSVQWLFKKLYKIIYFVKQNSLPIISSHNNHIIQLFANWLLGARYLLHVVLASLFFSTFSYSLKMLIFATDRSSFPFSVEPLTIFSNYHQFYSNQNIYFTIYQ